MVARWSVRLAVWLRDGNGGGRREAEWIMLLIKCTINEYVSDCRKCKKNDCIPCCREYYQF